MVNRFKIGDEVILARPRDNGSLHSIPKEKYGLIYTIVSEGREGTYIVEGHGRIYHLYDYMLDDGRTGPW